MFKSWFRRVKVEERPISVLVVSDDAVGLSLLNDTLVAHGYVMYSVASSAAAVKLLDEIDLPHMFIGDFVHPETAGKEFLERVRIRFGKSAQPPVLFLMDSLEDETIAQKMGVQDVLPKPFETETLLRCVKTLTDRARPMKVS